MRTTFGACRKDGVLFLNILNSNNLILFQHLLWSRAAWMSDRDTMMHKNSRETRHQAHAAENKNETRRRAACRRRSEVDVPLGGGFFVKIIVADIACLPAPEN